MSGFSEGLVEVGDGLQAYLQPDGSWCLSNAGLITGDRSSLLVDTLIDLPRTRRMLHELEPHVARAPIETVVNTHANGDHCFGNQLVAGPGVAVYASDATAEELHELPPARIRHMMATLTDGALGEFMRAAFGRFDFEGIEMPAPTHRFSGRKTLDVGGRAVELIEVGPAHTAGDTLVWVPDARVVFAGDILFNGGTPIMWAGPVANWIAACETIAGLAPRVVVPGHGPLTDASCAVELGQYFRFVQAGVAARHSAGMTPLEASRDLDRELDGTLYGKWGDRERLVVTVHAIWRELDPSRPTPDANQLFRFMAEDYARRR